MYKPSSVWTWAFLITSAVQAIIILALESYVFGEFQISLTPGLYPRSEVRVIPTYLTIFIFGFLYQLVLVYDALKFKNTIQILGICAYNVGMLIYAAVQPGQIQDSMNILFKLSPSYLKREDFLWPLIRGPLIAVPIVIGVTSVSLCFIASKLYHEFAWTIYKHISADIRMKRRFLLYQIYIALLKFDFFFFLGFTVQFVVVVSQSYDVEFYLTIGVIPVSIIILFMAAHFTRKENKPGMLAVIVLYFCALAYFVFKMTRMYASSKIDVYMPVRKSLTIFAVITIVLIVLTIINACYCMSNFGKGLKPFVQTRKIDGDEEKNVNRTTELPDLKYAAPPNRMEID